MLPEDGADQPYPKTLHILGLIVVHRLQVLTPLSLLVNITAVMVCSIAVTPGIRA